MQPELDIKLRDLSIFLATMVDETNRTTPLSEAFAYDLLVKTASLTANAALLAPSQSRAVPGGYAPDASHQDNFQSAERIIQRRLTRAADSMTDYLKTSPDNPFPFSYRKGLAEKLNALAGAMTDMGIVLPESFIPSVKAAMGAPGARGKTA